jgi:protein-disulfide isomerase-like protein with CxxC motif
VEAALRAVIYVRRAEGGADERSFVVLKELHDAQPAGRPRSMAQLKEVLREQSLLLRMDEERAVAAIPQILPRDPEERARVLRAVERLTSAEGELSSEGRRRLARIKKLFAVPAVPAGRQEAADVGD